MKNVLIITYFWPPCENYGGVQRITKLFSKIKHLGYNPIILASYDPGFLNNKFNDSKKDIKDLTVYRTKDIFNLRINRISRKNSQNSSIAGKRSGLSRFLFNIKQSLLAFIWLNLFIPDSKIGWYFSARKEARIIIKKLDIEAIISTGPPYTDHLVGLHVKRRYNLPWIVDVRDPWIENVYYNVASRTRLSKWINSRLEKQVLNSSNCIVTVGEKLSGLVKSKTLPDKVHTIYNGYDEHDFKNVASVKSQRFRLCYYGSLFDFQVPINLLKSLKSKLTDDAVFATDLLFELYGNLSSNALSDFITYLPETNLLLSQPISQNEVIGKYKYEQVLFLLIPNTKGNELILTTKLFEYLRAGWPILAIGSSDCEANLLVEKYNSGKMFEYYDESGPVDYLMSLYENWKNNGLHQSSRYIPALERTHQANQLSRLLKSVIPK